MALIDTIRGFFSNPKNSQTKQVQPNKEYEKSRLIERILDLIGNIKKKNSFDSSIWSLANITSSELRMKKLSDLQKLCSSLENRLAELNNQRQNSSQRESLEASKWTGQKPGYMSSLDFDRFQRSDDYR